MATKIDNTLLDAIKKIEDLRKNELMLRDKIRAQTKEFIDMAKKCTEKHPWIGCVCWFSDYDDFSRKRLGILKKVVLSRLDRDCPYEDELGRAYQLCKPATKNEIKIVGEDK